MDEIYGTKIFIGRVKELDKFREFLAHPKEDKWILKIHGEGGMGKTQLLHKFIEIAQSNQFIVTSTLIDFYWTTYNLERGILAGIAHQLSPNGFESFHRASTRHSDDLVLLRELFINECKSLKDKPILLVFDTSETASEAGKNFLYSTLPQLKAVCREIRVVIAGRPSPLQLPINSTIDLSISQLDASEVADYFAQKQIDISFEQISKITYLSEGRPILIALVIDWIKTGNTIKQLVSYSKDEFEEAMIQRVLDLQSPADTAILTMAHLYRRFDETILSHVLGYSISDATSLGAGHYFAEDCRNAELSLALPIG